MPNNQITEAERKRTAEDINRNYLNLDDTVYFLNESAKKLGISTETQAKTPQIAAKKQKTPAEIRDGKGPINSSDLEILLNGLYFGGQSDEQIANLKAIQIYRLVTDDENPRKIEDVRSLIEAANYFEKKGNHESALQLADKVEIKGLVRNIYETEYNLLVKDKKYADAILVAKKAGMSNDKVDYCLERAEKEYGADKGLMGKVLLACMNML